LFTSIILISFLFLFLSYFYGIKVKPNIPKINIRSDNYYIDKIDKLVSEKQFYPAVHVLESIGNTDKKNFNRIKLIKEFLALAKENDYHWTFKKPGKLGGHTKVSRKYIDTANSLLNKVPQKYYISTNLKDQVRQLYEKRNVE